MNKKLYVITGVLALIISHAALSQDKGPGRDMSEMDKDGNSTVEKSEFAAMLNKGYGETDTNGGGISLEEYQAKQHADRAARSERRDADRAERHERRSERKAEREAERTKRRFESIDADGNGTISAEEYNAADDRMFERMDRDGDGILNDRRGRGEHSHRNRGKQTNK